MIGGTEEEKHANKRQNAGRDAVGKAVVFGALGRNGNSVNSTSTRWTAVKAAVEVRVKHVSIVVTGPEPGCHGLSQPTIARP